MKRDPRAFLSDVIEAGHAIQQADNNQLVWGVIQNNLPALLKQCTKLLTELDGGTS